MPITLARTAEGRAPYFAALDGVRAYCILLVLYNHLKAGTHHLTFINGHLGVDLFFLISGFLITTLLTREALFTGGIDLRAFYWRRFFRIVPVYLFVLAVYVVLTHTHGQAAKWPQLRHTLPYFLTMLNEYAPGSVFTHTWSLGIEEKFYLLWPVLAFIFARTLRARSAVLAGLFILVAIPPLLGHTYLARAYFGLLMGCLLALALAGPYADRIAAVYSRVPAAAILILFLLGFLAEHITKNLFTLFSLFSAVFLAHLILRPQTWLTRAHAWPPLRWLGRRSYAMYLVHILCLNAIEPHLPITSATRAVAAFLAATTLTALVAEILYRLVEHPCRQLGRAWLARHHELPRAI